MFVFEAIYSICDVARKSTYELFLNDSDIASNFCPLDAFVMF